MKIRLFSLNITQQFIAYLIVLSVIPLLIIGFFSYRFSRDTIQEQAKLYTLEIVKNQRDYLELELTQVETLITNISGEEEIRDALHNSTAANNTFTNLATQARIGYILNGYSNLDGLVSIDIFTLDGLHYYVGDTLDVGNIRTEVRHELFELALNNDRRVVWAGIKDNVNANSTQPQVITAARILSRFNEQTMQQEPVALILVNLSLSHVYDHFAKIYTDEGAFFLVIDANQRVIFHPDQRLIGSQVTPAFTRSLSRDQGTLISRIDNQDMAVSYVHSPLTGWTVMSLVPVNTLAAKTSVIRASTLMLLAISFGIVAFFASIYNRRMVSPLHQIIDRFKQLESGTLDWNDRLKVQGSDEVAELIRWFNTFLDNMQGRQQSEQALRESQERYALAVKGANDGLWDWNLTTNNLYLSSRWKAMLGYTDSEIGQSPQEWFGRIHPQDREPVQKALEAHLKGVTTHFEYEHRLERKDKSYCWVLARGMSVQDSTGAAYRMAGSHTDITERKQAEEQIKLALREKEVLLKEIHHRVKNNLQIISSLLNLQSFYVKDKHDLDIFRESQDRIRSMALVHEKLYESDNLAQINFPEYIRGLTAQLFQSHVSQSKHINLNTAIENVSLDLDIVVPCGLIINELVTNAFKHGFANSSSGDIRIEFKVDADQQLTLTVSNNGAPFPDDINIYNTNSLGLQLVNALVTQLEGNLELQRSPCTSFRINFPHQDNTVKGHPNS